MRNKKLRGFTLVEVIIAVVIIGILAGMLLISGGRSSDTAERKACESNRESIKSAWEVYKFANPGGGTTLQNFINANGFDQIANDRLRCPSGGTYTANDDSTGVNCSEHD